MQNVNHKKAFWKAIATTFSMITIPTGALAIGTGMTTSGIILCGVGIIVLVVKEYANQIIR